MCPASFEASDASGVAIVQSLADNEPDVDGIYRLTRDTPFNFSASARRTLVMPRGRLAPFNAQATLFLPPAFFALCCSRSQCTAR